MATGHHKARFQTFTDEGLPAADTPTSAKFPIFYHGWKTWNDESSSVEEILENLFPHRSVSGKLRLKRSLKRKVQITVDGSNGAAIYNDDNTTLVERFDLCRIKEIIYCGSIKKYSKHVILVVGYERDVRAHILVCENVKNAKSLYKQFIQMFTLYDRSQDSTSAEQGMSVIDTNITNVPLGPIAARSNDEKARSPEGKEIPLLHLADDETASVDNAFTVLARSRSVCEHDNCRRQIRKPRYRLRHISLPQ